MSEDTKYSGEVASVILPGNVEFICKAPNAEDWDRYVDKAAKGHRKAGQKELIYASVISHDNEYAEKVLDRFPAVAEKIVLELDGICGSDFEFESSFDDFTFTVKVDDEDLVFDAPTSHQYETFQTNIEDSKLSSSKSLRDMLRICCKDPARFDLVASKYPTILGPASYEVRKLCGTELKVTRKKG